MAAEVLEQDYTRLSNQLLRDHRISYKAKGIFGWMASHRDGFGVSPESIAAAGADGISAVKSALRELERYGYLTRSQVRTGDGTMGAFTYRITDMPSSEPVDGNHPAVPTSEDAENRRSEPVDGKPLADEPPAVNRPHKKTIPSKKINLCEKTTSSSPAEPADTEPAVEPEPTEGGGGGSDLRSIAEQIAAALDYCGQVPDKQQQEKLTAALVAALEKGWTVRGLARYLSLGNFRPDNPVAFYLAKLTTKLPDMPAEESPAAGGGIRGPVASAAEFEAVTVESFYGLPGGTDANMAAHFALRDQLAAQEARKGAHRPYSNDVWSRPATPAETVGIPWCGDVECEPIGRMREVVDDNGLKRDEQCPKCHPNYHFGAA
jgi:hypothetical protein